MKRKFISIILLTGVLFSFSSQANEAPSFRLDIMPVLFKAGCNTGSCHGSARGKDGFMLSLFGYDPKGDYFRITEDIIGRRINQAVPETSLLLLKAIGTVPHTGGECFDINSEYYKTLLNWIKAGAPDDKEEIAKTIGITLSNTKFVFKTHGSEESLNVTAKLSDGSTRDVTNLTRFYSNNPSIAKIDDHGLITSIKTGDTHVFAQYSLFTVGAEVIQLPNAKEFSWPNPPATNYIDDNVFSRLEKLRIIPSDVCDDETFLRRVTLDLAARPPSLEEYHAFHEDTQPYKRARKIDALLAKDEFSDYWTALWGEQLRIIGGNYGPSGTYIKAADVFIKWIGKQMQTNRPLNEFVSDMVTSNGSNLKSGPVNLYTMMVHKANIDPKALAADFSQLFLGVQIQCAECHNHPFDRWTMDDYYGFVSFFTGMKRKPGVEAREQRIYYDTSAAPAKHKVDNRPMPATILGEVVPVTTPNGDPRTALAAWLTSPKNELFSRNLANRIWAQIMGRGLVEPVDDMRVSNPPANEPLLAALSEKLVSYNFNLRSLVRDICNSRVYQLSSKPTLSNKLDERQFSRAYVRRLRADTLLDSIAFVSGVERGFVGFSKGTKAIQYYPRVGGDTGGPHFGDDFFKTFGRSSRATISSNETKKEPTLSQALHMIVGDSVAPRVRLNGLIDKMLKEKHSPEQMLETLFITLLSRKPTQHEEEALLVLINDSKASSKVYEDIVWGLMNSTEFGFNF